VTCSKRQKMTISRSIIEAVRSMNPPGRFLDKSQDTGLYFEVPERKALEKTAQALRDGAANLRKQLSDDFHDPDFLNVVFDAQPKDDDWKSEEDKKIKKPKKKKAVVKKAPVSKVRSPARSLVSFICKEARFSHDNSLPFSLLFTRHGSLRKP